MWQFDYASNLLFILNLCFAKLSVLQLLRLVTPVKLHLRLVLGAGAFVILWSIASELASAFQCKTPNTWKVIGNQCFDRVCAPVRPRPRLRSNRSSYTTGGILECLRGFQPDHRSRATDPPACHPVEAPDAGEEESRHLFLLRIAHSVCLTLDVDGVMTKGR